MNRRFIYIIAALVLGIIAVSMIFSFMRDREMSLKRLLVEKGAKDIVIAREVIKKGRSISPDMVTTQKFPPSKIEAGAFTYVDAVIGKLSRTTIYKGQQITASLVSFPRELTSLADKIPSGKRAMTISVDKVSSINGMISPGNKVDIIGMFSDAGGKLVVPMFHKVLILAVGRAMSASSSSSRKSSGTITLALSPEQGSLLTYAMEIGKIKILLRPKVDIGVEESNKPVTMKDLQEKILGIKHLRPLRPPPPPPTVEVYKGTEKESVEVSK